MAGEMCTIYPSVKGKKSKLYMDMYNKTGHDRKLTNFLYAIRHCVADSAAGLSSDPPNIPELISGNEML